VDERERDQALGREFLTWLWATTELEHGEFELDGQPTALVVDSELVLGGDDDQGGIDILRLGEPATSAEAGAALRSGKKARQVRFLMARDGEEWTFTLDERLQLRGARLPTSESEHPLDILADQLTALRALGTAVDELFARFARIRLAANEWKGELKRLGQWIADK